MLYREIIAVCSQIHTKHINTLCGQNVELLNVKLAVHIVTTGLFEALTKGLLYLLGPLECAPLPHQRCQFSRSCTAVRHLPLWSGAKIMEIPGFHNLIQ